MGQFLYLHQYAGKTDKWVKTLINKKTDLEGDLIIFQKFNTAVLTTRPLELTIKTTQDSSYNFFDEYVVFKPFLNNKYNQSSQKNSQENQRSVPMAQSSDLCICASKNNKWL